VIRRKCKGCGKRFRPSRPNQEYCAGVCRKNRYELTRAGKERKREYRLSLLGTIAQAKCDSSLKGQDRKQRYRTAHPKPRPARFFYEGQMPTNRSEAELILKHIDQQPKKQRARVRAACKALLKPIYAYRDKCAATSTAKDKMIHDETLYIAQEKDIRPEEAFELLKKEWTKRRIQPRWWFRWERYCTPEELEELQIHRHEVKVQALATYKSVSFDEAMKEYKDQLYKDIIADVMFRAELMGKMNPTGKYTQEQFNRCMNDAASRFDFQWAGGKPVFLGPREEWPTPEIKFRRPGTPAPSAPSLPNTTDSEMCRLGDSVCTHATGPDTTDSDVEAA
jgi:hypothetical protein